MNIRKTNLVKRTFEDRMENFCHKTSLHGFADLYSSTTLFWRITWIILCVGACLITTYQICTTVHQYVTEPTTTTIVAAEEENIYYPSLRLCYWEWYRWIDWNIVKKHNISKNVLLYSGSFFNDVFTENKMDINQAKEEFERTMTSQNFTTLAQFYNWIARSVPIADTEFSNVSHYFDRNEVIYNDKTKSLMFCNKLHGSKIFQYFTDQGGYNNKVISFKVFDESFDNVKHVLTETEYNEYILRWVKKMSIYKINLNMPVNFTEFAPPITLFIFNNRAKGINMVVENDGYVIDVDTSVFTWLNRNDRKCREGKISIASDTDCADLCDAQAAVEYCDYLYLDQAIILRNNPANNTGLIGQKQVNFLRKLKRNHNGSENITMVRLPTRTHNCSSDWASARDACVKKCIPACQTWKYEQSVTITSTSSKLKKFGSKKFVEVLIEYPRGEDVIIMAQINAQTWEKFIGNVGGILGIWTGASVISFFQLFYLCCFEDCCHKVTLCPFLRSIFPQRHFLNERQKQPTKNYENDGYYFHSSRNSMVVFD